MSHLDVFGIWISAVNCPSPSCEEENLHQIHARINAQSILSLMFYRTTLQYLNCIQHHSTIPSRKRDIYILYIYILYIYTLYIYISLGYDYSYST